MKKLMKFAALLIVGAMVFTACEKDVVLNVPGDATIDLGDEFDALEGVSVDGANVEDVDVLWDPAWNEFEVNHYIASYEIEGETAQRNVYVQADKLGGNYAVTDEDDDGTTYNPYPVIVARGEEYNELRFNELFFNDIIVDAIVDGSVITIPQEGHIVEGENVSIQGTGTYDGENQKILTIDYEIGYPGEDVITGTSTFN